MLVVRGDNLKSLKGNFLPYQNRWTFTTWQLSPMRDKLPRRIIGLKCCFLALKKPAGLKIKPDEQIARPVDYW